MLLRKAAMASKLVVNSLKAYMNDDQPSDNIFTDQKTGVQLNDNVFV